MISKPLSCKIGQDYVRTLLCSKDNCVCSFCSKVLELPAFYCQSRKQAFHQFCMMGGEFHRTCHGCEEHLKVNHWRGSAPQHIDISIDHIEVVND